MSNVQGTAADSRTPSAQWSFPEPGPSLDLEEAGPTTGDPELVHDLNWEAGDDNPTNDGADASQAVAHRFHEQHAKYLRDRAIDLDLAWREGVRSLSEEEARQQSKCFNLVGTALAFPYGSTATSSEVHRPYTRVQLDDREHNEGKTRALPGVTPPPYIPSSVSKDGDSPLFIVEAPAKALSMVSNGFFDAIGCGGVNAGVFEKGSNKVQPFLLEYLRPSRPVFILFDAGRTTNLEVARAEATICRALLDLGIRISVVELPAAPHGEDGPDDFLARHGSAAMTALVARARPADPAAWAHAAVDDGPTVARSLIEHLPFLAALDAGGPREMDGAAIALKGYFDKITLKVARTDFHVRLDESRRQRRGGLDNAGSTSTEDVLKVGDHVEVANRYLKKLGPHVRYTEGSTYTYAAGVWSAIDPRQQVATVSKFSGALVEGQNGPRPLRLKEFDCKGILGVAQSLVSAPSFFEKAPRGLAFTNGFVTIEGSDLRVRAHAPENRARFAYGFDFDPTASRAQWLAFLADLWEGDTDAAQKVDVMQEFFGACLLGLAPRYKKCVVLIGDTDSGKSTCLDIIRGTFPPGTTEAIAPADWKNDYKRASLAGKLLNTVGELPEREWIETESFKAFVGEDPINARQIFTAPFTYFSQAGHIFAANALPRVADRSDATWNRMIVITCSQRFYRDPAPGQRKARDGLAAHLLATEMPGVLSWAIEGVVRLVGNGKYTIPASSDGAVARWKELSDQLEEFFRDNFQVAPGTNVSVTAVFNLYNGWATATNHKKLSSERFRETFTAFLARKTGDREPKYKSHGIMVYRGIKHRYPPMAELSLEPVQTADSISCMGGHEDEDTRGQPQHRPGHERSREVLGSRGEG